MKSLRRYSLLLLCLVLSLGAFSVSVSAEEIDTSNVAVNVTYAISGKEIFAQTTALNGILAEDDVIFKSVSGSIGPGSVINQNFAFYNTDGSILFEADKEYTFSADNFVNPYFTVVQSGSVVSNLRWSDCVRSGHWRFLYSDGTYEDTKSINFASIVTFNDVKGTFKFDMKFTPEKDVTKLYFYSYCTFAPGLPNITTRTIELQGGFIDYPLVVITEAESDEVGLLQGIWNGITGLFDWLKSAWDNMTGWLSDIWTTMKNGFSDLVAKLTSVINSILELPSKIWGFIENGLKSLFVPSDEALVSIKDDWDLLLADKLGAVYQVSSIIIDSFEGVQVAEITKTVEFPEVVLPLPDDVEFTFGGYDVKIVPDGFEFLQEICKLITSMVCTLSFVNGLRSKYDEVMGVEK